MKKIILGIILGLVIGFIIMLALFYTGEGIFPVLRWDWSLKNIRQNCLYIKTSEIKQQEGGSAEYHEVICLRNTWKGSDH